MAVSKREAHSDGKTSGSKHSRALWRIIRPTDGKCQGAYFSGDSHYCHLRCDLWSGWLERYGVVWQEQKRLAQNVSRVAQRNFLPRHVWTRICEDQAR